MNLLLPLMLATALQVPALQAGDQGHGMSVFRGMELERFEVEFLGRLEAWGGTGDAILGRLSGPGVDVAGVSQGMSGSPVYFRGELVGAVMSAWPFSKEAIAGIRPIEEMRVLEAELAAGIHPGWKPGDRWAQAPTTMSELPAIDSQGLSWSAQGFPAALLPGMSESLGSNVQGAATSQLASATEEGGQGLEAGDAVAVMLVDGDARLYSTGTVTSRNGNSILAFGHPFLSAGPLSLPMHRARVITVLPSLEMSFKLAEPLERVGALLLDRRAGVAGQLGVDADTLPLEIRMRADGEDRTFRFELGRLPQMMPELAAWCAQAAMLDRQDLRPGSSLQLSMRIEGEGMEALQSEARLSGGSIGANMGAEIAFPLSLLLQNPERPLRLTKVSLELEVEDGRELARFGRHRIVGEAHPGEDLVVEIELLPWRGEARWEEIRLPLPSHLKPGSYSLHLSDGAAAFREELVRGGARYAFPSLRTIQDAFADREPADRLVAVLYGSSSNAVVHGRELERWPASLRARLGTQNRSERVLATSISRQVLEIGSMLGDSRQIPIEISGKNSPGRKP